MMVECHWRARGCPVRRRPWALKAVVPLELFEELVKNGLESGIVSNNIFNFMDRMKNSGMISPPEMPPNFRQGQTCELPGQKHGRVTGADERLVFFL